MGQTLVRVWACFILGTSEASKRASTAMVIGSEYVVFLLRKYETVMILLRTPACLDAAKNDGLFPSTADLKVSKKKKR
jgi:hypothetical protein